MAKFIWMSDLHFVAEGLVQGHDPRVRLAQAISLINEHHSDAAFCVVSGDMVDRGTDADYAALASMLSGLTIPYLPLTGNHDSRPDFRRHLALPENTMRDFIQYEVCLAGARVICLDTLKQGSDSGELCAARRAWLRARLSEPDPALIVMHHPPLALGLPMQDQDRLDDGEDVLDLLAASSNVGHLCMGHVHRPISGTAHGMPFTTSGSVLYQAPPPDPPWDWTSFRPAKEAPMLAVVDLDGAEARFQRVQICPYEVGGA